MDVPKTLPENPKVQLHNELFGIFIGRKQGLVKQTRLVDSPQRYDGLGWRRFLRCNSKPLLTLLVNP